MAEQTQPRRWWQGEFVTRQEEPDGTYAPVHHARNEIWDSNTSSWIPQTAATGGGGGGAVSIANGDDVAQGATTDPDTSSTVIGLLKKIKALLTGTLTVSVDNFPASGTGLTNTELRASPVPVSAASLPLPSGAAQEHSTAASPASVRLSDGAAYIGATSGRLDVQVGNFPATQPVSGTFWQATQPVSGTFWQATQPVSGPLTDTQLRATAVPVSGPLTDTQLRASAVPVSGPLTDTQLRASAVPISLGVALPAGTNRIGSVRVVDSADADLTAAKNAQTARFLGTQDAKDSGRSQVMLSWEEMTGTAAAESTLTNFTLGSRGGSALTAATNLTVTAGKTLRIQEVHIYVKATSTVNNLARFRLRQAASILNSSPVIWDAVLLGIEAPGTIAAGLGAKQSYSIPDGLEVAAGQQIAFTWFTAANTCTVGLSIVGYEY